jgi:hypothetical protein
MKVSVNLLQEAQKLRMRLRRIGLVLQSASVVTLGVFGILVFLLLSYTLFLGRKQANLSKSIVEQETKIEGLRAVEAKQLLVQQKIKLAETVVRDPSLPYDLATELYELAVTGPNVRSVSTVKGDGTVRLSSEVDNVLLLVESLDELVDFAKDHGVIVLMGNSFSRNDKGIYNFQITLTIEER